jgi:hypothetical protein
MFASTRPLTNPTLRSTPKAIRNILTEGEDHTCTGERSFPKYARQVHIFMPEFGPDILFLHFRHFQTLGQVHSLTIENYDAISLLLRSLLSHPGLS